MHQTKHKKIVTSTLRGKKTCYRKQTYPIYTNSIRSTTWKDKNRMLSHLQGHPERSIHQVNYTHTWNACTFFIPLLLYIFGYTVKVLFFFSIVHFFFVTYGSLFCVFASLLIFPLYTHIWNACTFFLAQSRFDSSVI